MMRRQMKTGMSESIRILPILRQGWTIYRRHFGLIAGIVVVVMVPYSAASYGIEALAYVEVPRLSAIGDFALYCGIQIIASAALTFVAMKVLAGEQPRLGTSLRAAAGVWKRMLWTRVLFMLAISMGLLVAIVPGIWMLVRFGFCETVVVTEGLSGVAALRRSMALTEGRFFAAARLFLAGIAVLMLLSGVVYTPLVLAGLDEGLLVMHLANILVEFAAAWAPVTYLCAYQVFRDCGGGDSRAAEGDEGRAADGDVRLGCLSR